MDIEYIIAVLAVLPVTASLYSLLLAYKENKKVIRNPKLNNKNVDELIEMEQQIQLMLQKMKEKMQ